MMTFKFTYIVYLYPCLLILLWISIAVYCPFISTWKTLFSIWRKADLLVTKISQFLFVRSALIAPSFLKDSFSEYRIFGKLFFLSAHCICHLLPSGAHYLCSEFNCLSWRLTMSHYTMAHFSPTTFKILSLSLPGLWVYITWSLLSFLNMSIIVFF